MLLNIIRRFLQLESSGGIILFLMAVVALILNNSPWVYWYEWIFREPFTIDIGPIHLKEAALFWINEGLMTLFFLLIGLELKREFRVGQLRHSSLMTVAAVAAAGGMVVPAIIYVVLNGSNTQNLNGWAIPVATDIAFTLGVLSLFNKRVPVKLKLFLMTLAIFDDIGAIVIIALFYVHGFFWPGLIGAIFTIFVLFWLNQRGVDRLAPYLVLGGLLWFFMLQSGIHPTLSGLILALLLPLSAEPNAESGPLLRLEKGLHPWVVYLVMPLFALANAGVSFAGLSSETLKDTVTLGIILGLVLGKPVGIVTTTFLMVKAGWASLPHRVNWRQFVAGAMLCGIGFTMSLFLGTLAFQHDYAMYLAKVRLGVLLGSMLSIIIGAMTFIIPTHDEQRSGS